MSNIDAQTCFSDRVFHSQRPSAMAGTWHRVIRRCSPVSALSRPRQHAHLSVTHYISIIRFILPTRQLSRTRMSTQNYIVKFKKGAKPEDVEKFYSDVAKQGGEVKTKEHESKSESQELLWRLLRVNAISAVLPRAIASLPDSFVQSINGLTKDNRHDAVEYIGGSRTRVRPT